MNAIRGIDDEDADVPSEIGALSDNVALILVVVVVALFLLGMIFFLIYYLLLHPEAVGANLCIRGEEEEITKDDQSLAPLKLVSCGDNYRVHRDAKQFRSWHSASLNYSPEISASVKKRPSSEIISSTLYDPPHPQNSAFELKSGDCSCYSMKNDSFHNLSSVNAVISDPLQRSHKPRGSISSYAKAVLHTPYAQDKRNSTGEAERKRRQVEELLEKKQQEKRELEQKQAMLQRSMENRHRHSVLLLNGERNGDSFDNEFEVQDLFNRKKRALHLYSPKSPNIHHQVAKTAASIPLHLHATPHRTIHTNPVAPQSNTPTGAEVIGSKLAATQLHSPVMSLPRNHNDSNSANRARLVASGGSGTFPRRSRPNHFARQAGRSPFLRGGSLKPISEVQGTEFTTRRSTASLMDLALPRYPKLQSVPRAMSFTVSKNEVVEAIESSL